MPLTFGQKLAHYEILSSIGAGGMGEVYRARDTKLGRDVAVKVLPDELSSDPARFERFRREARLLAQINHPHVATLHGLEETDGRMLLVMELVDGETLAERFSRGLLPKEEAIPLFVQIAKGLEAAHEKGVVHRDLKPANVKIRPDGQVKILDFGLAKAFAAEEDGSAERSQSTTLTRGTALGAILGTASYMSPEQARGTHVDKRTDIWAFGCCLYEALTGRKAFDGETVSDVIGSVLRDDPDRSRLPPEIAVVVRRCLRKDPRERLRDIGDARLELLEPPAPTMSREREGRPMVPWVLFGLSAVAVAWLALREPARPTEVTRFVTMLPEGYSLYKNGPEQVVAMSPDGAFIAYTTSRGNRPSDRQLYVLDRSRFAPVPVPRTEGAWNPFFSPDGSWLGFFAGGKLKKVSVAGGSPIAICDANPSPGASWGQDDQIVYADRWSSGFLRVSAGGGEPETLTTLLDGETGHRWPQHLPDGDSLLYSIRTSEGTRIVVQALRTGVRRTVFSETDGATQALYLASGHLLYDQPEGILVSAFELDSLAKKGSPASPLPDAHSFQGAGGLSYVAASAPGDVVFLPASATRTIASLRSLSERGDWSELSSQEHQYESIALDPEGRRIALGIAGSDGGAGIWVYDIARSSLTPLVRDGGNNTSPVWTPDGRRLTFTSGRRGRPPNLFAVPSDGSAVEERVFESGEPAFPVSWSPDGSVLAFISRDQISILRKDGRIEPFLPGPASAARFSPDGHWLAYVSAESGRDEVYVTSYPVASARVPISTEGGDLPVWSPDGRRLYFRNGKSILRVSIGAGERVEAGLPELVVDADVIDFDLTPDERIVAIRPEGSRGWDRLHVVLGWTEELRQMLPEGG